ncbi:uncharacterized protein LOC107362019 [Tetranychus urticae]|uniref:uncharacterized protein LOC107362019 n=1 Tax=Tetranychus urticae TaxID=32264 RepID=UPI00077B9F5A|nr:uncharacterized protein LOC107362019 [Tetranychus urticae]
MLINELPDDCLLTIFDYLNNLDDLINCYKVCIKWSYLIAERTRKVKYLLEFSKDPAYSSDLVYYQRLDLGTRYETLLYTLFPNLLILHNLTLYDAAFVRRVPVFAFLNKLKDVAKKRKDLERFDQGFRVLKSLKGIINC